jgi:putative membrane protein
MRFFIAGRTGKLNQEIFMKNKMTMISRFSVIAAGAGLLCFATPASALPHLYPPLKSGGRTDASPSPSTESKGKAASKLSAKDKAFMLEAAKGGQMEVQWGKWAAQNGQNADVKKFGNRMVADHSKANDELMALAKEEGVALPAAKVSGKWKSDKDYMDMMVKDHEKDWAEFQKEVKEGSDPDLKKWAEKTSKTIQKHLEMAKEIQGKLK